MCSHAPIFRTDNEPFNLAPKRSQGYHAKFVGAFHLSRRLSDENRTCSISIPFFKLTDPWVGRSFSMCSHDPIFGTNKNRILENRSCERAFTHSVVLEKFIRNGNTYTEKVSLYKKLVQTHFEKVVS